MSCRIETGTICGGLGVIRIENDLVALEILPELGAKVVYIERKRSGRFSGYGPSRWSAWSYTFVLTSTTTPERVSVLNPSIFHLDRVRARLELESLEAAPRIRGRFPNQSVLGFVLDLYGCTHDDGAS